MFHPVDLLTVQHYVAALQHKKFNDAKNVADDVRHRGDFQRPTSGLEVREVIPKILSEFLGRPLLIIRQTQHFAVCVLTHSPLTLAPFQGFSHRDEPNVALLSYPLRTCALDGTDGKAIQSAVKRNGYPFPLRFVWDGLKKTCCSFEEIYCIVRLVQVKPVSLHQRLSYTLRLSSVPTSRYFI